MLAFFPLSILFLRLVQRDVNIAGGAASSSCCCPGLVIKGLKGPIVIEALSDPIATQWMRDPDPTHLFGRCSYKRCCLVTSVFFCHFVFRTLDILPWQPYVRQCWVFKTSTAQLWPRDNSSSKVKNTQSYIKSLDVTSILWLFSHGCMIKLSEPVFADIIMKAQLSLVSLLLDTVLVQILRICANCKAVTQDNLIWQQGNCYGFIHLILMYV